MINFKIKIDDKEILKMIKKQKPARLSVGFWDDVYDGKGISVAAVAAFNEFGGGHTPPRPFMHWTVKNRNRKWRNIVRDILPQYAHDIKKVMSVLGEYASEDLSDVIRIWTRPPNAPSTIKKKGFNDPLVETGKMMNSVRWKVK